MRRRIKSAVSASLALRPEKFELEGIVYRFDAQPVLKVIKRAQRMMQGERVGAVMAFLAIPRTVWVALAVAWSVWDVGMIHYWATHYLLPSGGRAFLRSHDLPTASEALHALFMALPHLGS
jgi:hypothetical protein